MKRLILLPLLLAAPALAQQFTTAAEVKPILEATRMSWIALREYEGQDLLYFTHLAAWRCGLSGVTVSVPGVAMNVPLTLEPCHEGTAQPNAITDDTLMPYVTMPLGAGQQVSVTVTLDDGSVLTQDYTRAQVLMP
jgi:uncharacterized membrane protein AbrB (regulator of aidB expression)